MVERGDVIILAASQGELLRPRRASKLVGAASVPFVRWMHEHVPASQLSPEQVAMVNWFQKNKMH